jgi:hypothetical protein
MPTETHTESSEKGIVFDQYYAGGVWQQLIDALGLQQQPAGPTGTSTQPTGSE